MSCDRVTLTACLALLIALSGCSQLAGGDAEGGDPTSTIAARPNILLIVADDLGYSDIASYGSEIRTPVFDRLAEHGVRFADFAVAPTCSTTRSMLLTGVDNHLNGLGGLDQAGRPQEGSKPGYEGHLNLDVVTVSTLLKDAGYHTYMVGKWHLGRTVQQGPEARGFERVLVNPAGAGDHFSTQGVISTTPTTVYRENGAPAAMPESFYSSTFFTDKLIEYIAADKDSGRPFFAYAAYTAPHWPLQAPDEFIERYDGVYDEGYDAIRSARVRRLVEQGFFKRAPELNLTGAMARPWDQLDTATRARESRRMQVYAAMVEALDHEIGRLLDHLAATGELENTVIIFMSDNGPEGNDPYVIARNMTWIPANFATDTESLGRPGSYAAYGPGWAEVSATPFRLYKAFTAEGGLRVPLIVAGPGIGQAGEISHQFASVLDVTPTILDLAGVAPPHGDYRGQPVHAVQGRSMLPYLTGAVHDIHPPEHVMGWELFNRRAVRKDGWKLIRIDPPYGPGRWQLYDLTIDPFERRDLAASHTDELNRMITHWEHYAAANNVAIGDYSTLRYGNENHHYAH